MSSEGKRDERKAIRRDLFRIDDRRLSMVDVRKPWGGRQMALALNDS